MATIFEDQAPTLGPKTHVLIIGVGNYPHLLGGNKKKASKPLGLGQLTSPPISAQQFAEWWLAPLLVPGSIGFANADCPLATLDVLISSANPTSVNTPDGPKQVLAANRQGIQNAFDAWLDRVASHDDNIGVFYFCGHGIKTANHFLLAEDFGEKNGLPWENALDISNTILASIREVKGSLFFLLDACKAASLTVAQTIGANPSALRVVDLEAPVTAKSTSEIFAAGEGRLAFAAEGKVSRFTDAMITSLSGFCGIKNSPSPTWDTDGEILAAAIRKLLENGNKTAKRRQISGQRIEGDGTALVKANTAPRVKVELDLAPENRRSEAFLWVQAQNNRHDGKDGVFKTELKRGFHNLGADPKNGEFPPIVFEDEELIPPLYSRTMEAPQ